MILYILYMDTIYLSIQLQIDIFVKIAIPRIEELNANIQSAIGSNL